MVEGYDVRLETQEQVFSLGATFVDTPVDASDQGVTANYGDGRGTIVREGPTAYEREIHDMDRFDLPLP